MMLSEEESFFLNYKEYFIILTFDNLKPILLASCNFLQRNMKESINMLTKITLPRNVQQLFTWNSEKLFGLANDSSFWSRRQDAFVCMIRINACCSWGQGGRYVLYHEVHGGRLRHQRGQKCSQGVHLAKKDKKGSLYMYTYRTSERVSWNATLLVGE